MKNLTKSNLKTDSKSKPISSSIKETKKNSKETKDISKSVNENILDFKKPMGLKEEFKGFSKQNFIKIDHGSIYDSYDLKARLGKGSFGEVWKAEEKISKNQVAVKIIPKKNLKNDKEILNQIKIEYDLLKKMDHPNIMRIYGAFENQFNIYIVCELLSGDTILSKNQNKVLNEKEVAFLFSQILKALAYCHERKIVHRDIKPENCVYDDNTKTNLKLIDFGLSAVIHDDKGFKEILGSPLYMAPEIISNKLYNEKIDIWSLGIMMYIFLAGRYPYTATTREELNPQILSFNLLSSQLFSPSWSHLSDLCKDFLSRMLILDPDKRASAIQLLNHDYLTKEYPIKPISVETSKMIFNSFNEYYHLSSMQKMIRNLLVTHSTMNDNIKELNQIFMKIDTEKNGSISFKEFESVSQPILEMLNISKPQLLELFKQMDTDKSGCIDYSEFLTAMLNNYFLQDRLRLESAFNFLDRDKSGFITTEDFKQLFNGHYGAMQPMIEEMMKECDTQKDNKISLEEFITFTQKVLIKNQSN